MRAEDVWRLPQSLRDGWRCWVERPGESHRDGWLLITCVAHEPCHLFFPFLFSLSLLSSLDVFLLSRVRSHRLVQDARQRNNYRHPQFPFSRPLFLLFLSLIFFLHILAQRIPVQFWSCRREQRTAPGAMPLGGYEHVFHKKHCWQGRWRGNFFLSIKGLIIYQSGEF